MNFIGIPSQAALQFFNNSLKNNTINHEDTGVMMEVAHNQILSLEFDEICTAPHLKNVLNAAFAKLEIQTKHNFQL